jgi:hypothetical protein
VVKTLLDTTVSVDSKNQYSYTLLPYLYTFLLQYQHSMNMTDEEITVEYQPIARVQLLVWL